MSTFDDMVSFVEAAYPARKYIVPCLEGPTGIGKTAAVKEAAKKVGAGKVVTIILSQALPNEISGITMPVAESKAMEIFDHYRLSTLEDGDILFLDELLEADQFVLSACLTLIESRELMSGRKLPDIMIVAATNATVKPDMLKENIRQRFVWRKFGIDKQGCQRYILNTCGFDVGFEVVNELQERSKGYNILTPRSLTKMAQWIADAKDYDERQLISQEIDKIWNSQLGTKLFNAYNRQNNSATNQVRKAIQLALEYNGVSCIDLDSISEGLAQTIYNDESFEQTSMTELIELLSKLPEWETIAEELSEIELNEGDSDCEISF